MFRSTWHTRVARGTGMICTTARGRTYPRTSIGVRGGRRASLGGLLPWLGDGRRHSSHCRAASDPPCPQRSTSTSTPLAHHAGRNQPRNRPKPATHTAMPATRGIIEHTAVRRPRTRAWCMIVSMQRLRKVVPFQECSSAHLGTGEEAGRGTLLSLLQLLPHPLGASLGPHLPVYLSLDALGLRLGPGPRLYMVAHI